MAYYHTCSECGAFLDPGEKCDCSKKSEQLRKKYEQLTAVTNDGQIVLGGNLIENCKNQNKKPIWH
ncbi:hypothetical protein I5677_12285 [Mobilitalea sibirica]|uniref:Uncharacterized protein n=1 Tax=Mobilitalea sibirica TaxID=1462919 RepID=A0A8J7H3I9_9FIRM|nr:hypothetical protein [Mobilitalea sibirica]MBH1941672.1 hypothetical protein [Mobilitalea sibirica]